MIHCRGVIMMVINKGFTYQQFWDAVKEKLARNLACWELTEDQIEEYMDREENQIKGAYKNYAEDRYESVRNRVRTEEACFKSSVSSVAYCLEMCY